VVQHADYQSAKLTKEDAMADDLSALELRRLELQRKLIALGDFRRGSVTVTRRKCGKKNCVCAKAGNPGHSQYLWTTTRGTKSEARSLRLGPEMEKYVKEVDAYKTFMGLTAELVEVNEKICNLRPAREIEDERELESLKKKLQRRFTGKRSKK
jgi:hypothetical protein